MASKKLADICSKRGFPKAVVDAMKPLSTVETNEVTNRVEVIVDGKSVVKSGNTAPNNADGSPDGSIYIQF